MSCRSPPTFAARISMPSSPATAPATCAVSIECSNTFWPYEVRHCSRPRMRRSSVGIPVTPTSSAASSPFLSAVASTSPCAFSTTSSMRTGWIRPSCIRRSMVTRATWRRTGSKEESVTCIGVSSMSSSTPVAASSARMLRPSRPIRRPFISSLASLMCVTECSVL